MFGAHLIRNLRRGLIFRSFNSIDPLESQVINSSSNTELVKLLKDSKLSLNVCVLSMHAAALNINKDFTDLDILRSPHFDAIVKRIERLSSKLTFQDLCNIIFLIRTLDSCKVKRVFTKDFEKYVFFKAIEEVRDAHDKKTVIELYCNLSVLQKATFKLENKILQILGQKENNFTIAELQKLMIGASASSKVYTRITVMEIVKCIEKMHVESFSIRELTATLNPLQLIDQRYAIGDRLVARVIDNILLNISALDYLDIREIMLFYSNTDHFNTDLLHESLVRLTELLRTSPETLNKLNFLHIHRYLGLIVKPSSNLKLTADLLEGMDMVAQRYLDNKEFGYMEIGRFLVAYSHISPCLSPSFKIKLVEFMSNGPESLWQLFAVQGLSKLDSSIPVSFIIKDIAKTHGNILGGSYKVKLDALDCILSTQDYLQKPYLGDLLQLIIADIMRKIEDWSEAKYFLNSWPTRRRHLIDTPEMRPIILKLIDTISNQWDRNLKWWSVKFMIELFSEQPQIKERWAQVLIRNIGHMDNELVCHALSDNFDTAHLPAMINLSMLLPVDSNTLAHILSFPVKDLPELYTTYAVELLNKSSADLINSQYFFISKYSVFASIFARGLSRKISQFLERLPEAASQNYKPSKNLLQLLLLLADYGHLDQELASNIAEAYRNSDNPSDLHTLILIIALGEPRHKDLPELIERLFHIDEKISLSELSEKINTYLLVGFTGKGEKGFLRKVEARLENVKAGDECSLVRFVEALNTPGEGHRGFWESVVELGAKSLEKRKEEVKYEVAMKALAGFAKKGYRDQGFYEKLEERVSGLEFGAEKYVKILTGYAKIKRNNEFFDKVCKKLASKVQNCLSYTGEILEVLNIEEMKSENLVSLTKTLQEKQNYSK